MTYEYAQPRFHSQLVENTRRASNQGLRYCALSECAVRLHTHQTAVGSELGQQPRSREATEPRSHEAMEGAGRASGPTISRKVPRVSGDPGFEVPQ